MLRFPVPMLRDICLFILPPCRRMDPTPPTPSPSPPPVPARNAKAPAGLTARGAAAVQHHGQSPARLS